MGIKKLYYLKIFIVLYFLINISLIKTEDSVKIKKSEQKFSINLENYGNVQYYGKIYIGPQNQEINVIFSTGSNLTWLPGNNCNECRNSTTKYTQYNLMNNKNFTETEYIKYQVI